MRPRGFPTGREPSRDYSDPVADAEREAVAAREKARQLEYRRTMDRWAQELLRPLTDEQRKALRIVLERLDAD